MGSSWVDQSVARSVSISKLMHRYALALMAALLVQVGLGITNVLATLPIAVAVAHNAGAALLLMSVVVLNFALYQESTR